MKILNTNNILLNNLKCSVRNNKGIGTKDFNIIVYFQLMKNFV